MLKRILASLIAVALYTCGTPLQAHAQYATLVGTLQSANGLPASNYGITFTPSQFGFISGTGVIINTTTACATSTDGSVVGLPNPLEAPRLSVGFTGTLPPANYYIVVAFYDATGAITLVSPEAVIQLSSTGRVIIAPPASGLPAGAVGMKVYVSTATNAETLQGTTTGTAAFLQSIPLVSGAAKPSSNTTVCKQVANDAIWPSGTGYTVALTDTAGNTLPGYPMMWQLMGPNSTINLSTGLPYYHGTVYFPTPILASPLNHNLQSISGPLDLSSYNLTDVGSLGCGTSLPAYSVDCPTINARTGYLLNGAAPLNHLLVGNGTYYVDAATIPSSAIGGLYYQTVKFVGSLFTQRPILDFEVPLSVTDDVGNNSTNIGLAASGVTAGSYTCPNLTLDIFGRTTAASSGSCGSGERVCTTGTTWTCYQVAANGTIEQWGKAGPVPTGTDSGTVAITFPTAFTTTNHLEITTSPTGCAGSSVCSGDWMQATNPIGSTVTTSGFTAYTGTGVTPGGGGSNLTASFYVFWHALGD